MQSFNFFLPTKIVFGFNQIDYIASMALPGSNALIVTTNGGSIIKNGSLKRLQAGLDKKKIDYTIFSEISANPTRLSISKGADVARENECDFVIGLGGGSAIDAAKAIAVLIKNGSDIWQFIQRGSGGRCFPKEKALPIVAITTTSGTGSEADPWMVVSNPETHEKIGCGWDFTYPTLTIVDASLMRTIPAKLTAMQGMDAFFHAAEGYIATCATPISEFFSLEAIRRITQFLPVAVHDGMNQKAREEVALASTLAGIVESLSDTVSQHYISHAMTAAHENLPHGAALIALCLQYFQPFVDTIPEKLATMAVAMGINDSFDSPNQGALAFMTALRKLIDDIDMEALDLRNYGLREEEAESIVHNAYCTDGHLFGITPADIDEVQMTQILRDSIRRTQYE